MIMLTIASPVQMEDHSLTLFAEGWGKSGYDGCEYALQFLLIIVIQMKTPISYFSLLRLCVEEDES